MSRGPWITPAKVEQVLALFAAGKRPTEVMQLTGLTYESVRRIRRGRQRGRQPINPGPRVYPRKNQSTTTPDREDSDHGKTEPALAR